MNGPVAWGVGFMLACIGIAINLAQIAAIIRELTELAHAAAPIIRAWLGERAEKRRIGYDPSP